MEELLNSNLLKPFPWQMYVATALRGALNATSLIIGGLAGWFAGAGKWSARFALLFILVGPIALYLVLYVVLRPYGALDQALQMQFYYVAIANYVGTLVAMLAMFFILRRGRIGWRNRFTPQTEAI